MAMVLFLLGLLGLVGLHAGGIDKYMKENVAVMVEMNSNSKSNEILLFQKKMESHPFIKTGTVEFISKEEALALVQKDFGEDMMEFEVNPLFDAIVFNVNSAFMQPDSMQKLKSIITEEDIVTHVQYDVDRVSSISKNMRKVAMGTFILSLLGIFIAASLINNTVKLALYSNRFQIKSMQLVGASWDFIRNPYLKRGLTNGLIGACIAIVGISIFYLFLRNQIPWLGQLANPVYFLILFVVILSVGAGISYLSTYRSVSKYLRLRLDDLF